MANPYVGRFAPSPTGPLHLGSLVAALASFLHAKHQHGKWLVRIDDLDLMRNQHGASQRIIDTLHLVGLHPDGDIYYQSQQLQHYHSALGQLLQRDLLYKCSCSRKSLASTANNCHCLSNPIANGADYAFKVKTNALGIVFQDLLQGRQSQPCDDFIVQRKDGIIAYQLAVVVDDYRQNISDVVRGCDLLESTSRQIFLQQALSYPTPNYCHIPILTDSCGNKLSKQTFAPEVCLRNPQQTLFGLLQLLNMHPPKRLETATVAALIQWATEHWDTAQLALGTTIKNYSQISSTSPVD